MNAIILIYTLRDPRTDQIRYIGKTNNLKRRINQHIKGARNNTKTKKAAWIKSLLNENVLPIIEILDECTVYDWQEVEQYWIWQFRSWGFKLVNSTNGGEGLTINNWADIMDTDTIQARIKIAKQNLSIGAKRSAINRMGKSYEELYGIEEASKRKKEQSRRWKTDNPSKPGRTISETTKIIMQRNSARLLIYTIEIDSNIFEFVGQKELIKFINELNRKKGYTSHRDQTRGYISPYALIRGDYPQYKISKRIKNE